MGPALDLEDYRPSVLLHCWLGHLTCKIVSEMTYNVSSGTLNPTIPYDWLLYAQVRHSELHWWSGSTCAELQIVWSKLLIGLISRQIIWSSSSHRDADKAEQMSSFQHVVYWCCVVVQMLTTYPEVALKRKRNFPLGWTFQTVNFAFR